MERLDYPHQFDDDCRLFVGVTALLNYPWLHGNTNLPMKLLPLITLPRQ